MTGTRFTKERGDESSAPVDMLGAFFEAHGWPVVRISEEEVSGEIQGSWAKYHIRAIWRATDNVLQLICLPDIRVPDTKRVQTCELLALVNEQMWLGHFDCWSQGGALVYRHAVLLGNDGMMSIDQTRILIESALDDCDRFYPAFQFVLWGEKDAQDALDCALVDAAGEA